MSPYLLAAIALLSSAVVAADSTLYQCLQGDRSRLIEVLYPGGVPLPCEVQYTKAEGTQTLWRAEHSEGYCEQRAEALVARQREWGWRCERIPPVRLPESGAE